MDRFVITGIAVYFSKFHHGIRIGSRLAGQPLLLHREPGNLVDGNAVILERIDGIPFAYLDRHTAAVVGPMMDAGILFSTKVIAGPVVARRRVPGGSMIGIKKESMRVRIRQIPSQSVNVGKFSSILNLVET